MHEIWFDLRDQIASDGGGMCNRCRAQPMTKKSAKADGPCGGEGAGPLTAPSQPAERDRNRAKRLQTSEFGTLGRRDQVDFGSVFDEIADPIARDGTPAIGNEC